jgi:hypothetical protein
MDRARRPYAATRKDLASRSTFVRAARAMMFGADIRNVRSPACSL